MEFQENSSLKTYHRNKLFLTDFFQSNYRDMNSTASIVKRIK